MTKATRSYYLPCLLLAGGCSGLGVIEVDSTQSDSRGSYFDSEQCVVVQQESSQGTNLKNPDLAKAIQVAKQDSNDVVCKVSTSLSFDSHANTENATSYEEIDYFPGCSVIEMSEFLTLQFDDSFAGNEQSYESDLKERFFSVDLPNSSLNGEQSWNYRVYDVSVKPHINLSKEQNGSFVSRYYQKRDMQFIPEFESYRVTTRRIDLEHNLNTTIVEECPRL